MSDYNFLVTLLATIFGFVAMVINVYSAYWQRRSVLMAIEAQRPENRPNVILPSSWWKNPSVIALFLLSCFLWAPYILSRLSAPTQLHSVSMVLDGPADIFNQFLNVAITISMDGNEIYTYHPQKAMAIAFHWPIDRDVDDTEEIQKSQVLDIRDSPLTFYINPDQKFIDSLNRGSGIFYSIIILPMGMSPNSFSTMRQAKMGGAKILPAGAGGISVQWRRVR
jgi:hypothetical protein